MGFITWKQEATQLKNPHPKCQKHELFSTCVLLHKQGNLHKLPHYNGQQYRIKTPEQKVVWVSLYSFSKYDSSMEVPASPPVVHWALAPHECVCWAHCSTSSTLQTADLLTPATSVTSAVPIVWCFYCYLFKMLLLGVASNFVEHLMFNDNKRIMILILTFYNSSI